MTVEDDPETSAHYRIRVLVDLSAEVDADTEARAVLALQRSATELLTPEERQAVRFSVELEPPVGAGVPAAAA